MSCEGIGDDVYFNTFPDRAVITWHRASREAPQASQRPPVRKTHLGLNSRSHETYAKPIARIPDSPRNSQEPVTPVVE